MTAAQITVVGCLIAVLGALRAAWSPCGQSMLASLTPLGERNRGFSWRVTATAFALGAIGGGALGGLVLGALGSLLPSGTSWRGAALAAVLGAALVVDATPLRRRFPLTRRQVNEDWMARYRGWVYGLGFGGQLGLGFTTLASCATIYAAFAGEVLCGSAAAGALIGAVFGAVKGLSLVTTRQARDPASLAALHRRLLRLEPGVVRGVVACEALALLAVLVTVT